MPKLADLKSYFLSHASPDKDFVKKIYTRVTLAGREAFLDEWSIEFGESIPRTIESALRTGDAFVLFWSKNAEASSWTAREYQSALSRLLDTDGRTLLVVRLDETEVPELVRDLKWIDGRSEDADKVAEEIMGLQPRERLMAMQETISELGMELEYFHGYGALVACPRCGATADKIEGWSQVDPLRDDTYAGARCTECGWEDGGEI